MLIEGSNNCEDNLDSQKLNGSKIGHLTWSLHKLKQINLVNSEASPTELQSLLDAFELVEFRYYSGLLQDRVLAKSVQLKLIYSSSSATAVILPRNLLELRMSQRPSEYFKFRIHGIYLEYLNWGQHVCSLENWIKTRRSCFLRKLNLLDVPIFEDTIFKSEKWLI